jgi:integrase
MRAPIPYTDFVTEVLQLYRPPLRRRGTFDKTSQVLREFAPLCASTADLAPVAIATWRVANQHRAVATLEGLLRHLAAACTYGASQGYLNNPFNYRPVSSWFAPDELDEAEEFKRHRSAAEIRAILAQADLEAQGGRWEALRLRAAVYCWAFTGAGKAEVLGLRMTDVDLVDRVIRIKSHSRRRLKTRARAAQLPIAWPLAEALASWLPYSGCEWVFPHKLRTGPWLTGRPGHRPLDQVRSLGERAGISGLTILAFRHSIGTLSEGWGIGELMLQRILRHSSRRTQWAYRHQDLDQLHDAAERIRY